MNFFGINQVLFTIMIAQIACTDALVDETYPFLVKIEAKGKFLVCAGTILTPCIVLTSANCVDGMKPNDVTVSHVTNRSTTYLVAAIEIHPDYNSTVLANDIALIRIQNTFEEPWSAVTLNNLEKDIIFPKCNSMQILGWSGHLMKEPVINDTSMNLFEKTRRANVRLISNENCSSLIKNFGGVFQGEEKLCGETEEVGCFIGPGGPLLCSLHSQNTQEVSPKKNWLSQQMQQMDKKGTLADPIDLLENMRNPEEKKVKRAAEDDAKNLQLGVVSWGKGCSKVPSVYIKTDYFYNWIVETARDMADRCDICGMFTFVNPLDNKGATVTDFANFNVVILSVSIAVLLRFFNLLFYFTVLT